MMNWIITLSMDPNLTTSSTNSGTLTGQATMLPKWAFGYVQSKERYATQAELLEVVREYRARGLPLDCIVQDWKHWTGNLWGQKSFDPGAVSRPAPDD